MERKPRILVAPLDWGLGHATRCIPVINALLKRNAEVIIAASGYPAALLKLEFPDLKHCSLPAYNPYYAKNSFMVWSMAKQLPGFIQTIRKEHKEVNKLVNRENIDVIISDNRYGCYSNQVKSVFITHQAHILMPTAFKWVEGTVNHFNQKQINRFNECWIPAPDDKILGRLLQASLSKTTRFIGYLSRFKKQGLKNKYGICAMASGPEPQRTMLVNLLRNELMESPLKTILVCGEVAGAMKSKTFGNYTEANYMDGAKLNEVVEQSEIVIARSGYSTIMDLARIGKKAIFIPTPGQTEQEHLAMQCTQQNIAFSMKQTNFNIKTALKESNKFSGFANFGYDDVLLDQAIQTIL